MRGLVARVCGLVLLGAVACASAEESDEEDTTSDTSAEGVCGEEARDDDYTLGLERHGERVAVRFVDALPSPPARFDNTWTIEVLDLASGAPQVDVELDVEPIMVDHSMHGTPIVVHVTALEMPGQLQLDPVYLYMPGLWEVRLHFVLASGVEDLVVFRFCVEP